MEQQGTNFLPKMVPNKVTTVEIDYQKLDLQVVLQSSEFLRKAFDETFEEAELETLTFLVISGFSPNHAAVEIGIYRINRVSSIAILRFSFIIQLLIFDGGRNER